MLSTDGVGHQSSPGSASREEPRCWNAIPGTRYHQLLHSNEAPLESELADIETASSDLDARLALLDEITRLKARVEQLEEERLAIGTRRQRNRASLSPLRRIPPEVLAEVFLWSLPPGCGDYNLDVKKSPGVLTHVCSRWRTVALSTSSLWSRILITYHAGNDSSSAYPLPLVKAHIQRSGSQQLAVTFRGCETSDWEPQVEVFHLRDQVPCLRKVWLSWECQPGIQSIGCFETACSLVDFQVSVDVPRYIPILLPVHQLTRYSMNAPWHHRQNSGSAVGSNTTATEVNTLMSTLTVSDVAGCAPVGLHLRCMIFGSDGRPFLDYALFLEMIRSRWRAVPRYIERAALVICEAPLPDPETLNALCALRREGLDLSVLEGDAADDAIDRLRYMG
ncbi:hypothetical protein GGX14DRAFT_410316 [Mycena pura]|uniref:F-box domain-containing protein n=1 Tax=Mycena pura TaxID=153505 RepID=A0AAD7E5M4_9AGAR|nr:hypothetical protein GGX14DRAFT_410316 [Mycena pura]